MGVGSFSAGLHILLENVLFGQACREGNRRVLVTATGCSRLGQPLLARTVHREIKNARGIIKKCGMVRSPTSVPMHSRVTPSVVRCFMRFLSLCSPRL